MRDGVRIPRKSITDSMVIAISRTAAKRPPVPRQIDQPSPWPDGAGGWTLLGGVGVSQVFVLSHRLSVQSNSVAVMHQPVEDGVGERGIADGGVPLVDGNLAGHDGGAALISIVDDFEQIAAVGVGHRRHGEIVEDQEIGLGKRLHELRIASVSTSDVELGE